MYKGEVASYELENHSVYAMPVTHCVFCKHCSDIFYDYTNGPYMFMCDKQLEPTLTEESCICDGFEHNGYKFDAEEYESRMNDMKKSREAFEKLLEECPEMREMIDEMKDKIVNHILHGEEE